MKLVAAAILVPSALAVVVVWCSLRHGQTEQAAAEQPVTQQQGPRKLRVCADPNNLPFSNERREGFENEIADLIARDLHAEVEYTWWAQRRGYVRNTLKAGLCDLVVGVSTGVDMLATSSPYYRSTYVFVSRKDRKLDIRGFDDPQVRRLQIGVQIIGDDYTNTPPAHALARRNIIRNVRGYRVLGDYSEPNPPARIIEAVAKGEVDVAVAWGPLAGYFASKQGVPLKIAPVSPQVDLPFLPFVYDISMGVRRGEDGFRQEIDAAIERNRGAIDNILKRYGVPRVDEEVVASL
jgi:mxaJ protein